MIYSGNAGNLRCTVGAMPPNKAKRTQKLHNCKNKSARHLVKEDLSWLCKSQECGVERCVCLCITTLGRLDEHSFQTSAAKRRNEEIEVRSEVFEVLSDKTPPALDVLSYIVFKEYQ